MTTPHADRDRSEPWWPPAATSRARLGREAKAVIFDEAQMLDEPVPYILADEPVGERVRAFPLDEGDTGDALLPAAPEGIELQCSMCPATLADTGGGVLWHHKDGSHTFEPSGIRQDEHGRLHNGAAAGQPLHRNARDRDADDTIPIDEQRRTRYVDAIIDAYNEVYCEGMERRAGPAEKAGAKAYAAAVMAVADAEQADLRADRDLWKARATVAQGKVARVAALADEIEHTASVWGNPLDLPVSASGIRRAIVSRLRRALAGDD